MATDRPATAQQAKFAQKHSDPHIAALEDPGYVIRCMILDAAKMYFEAHQCEPEVIHITPGMWALLSAHMRREGLINPLKDGITGQPEEILGWKAVYDASDFKLE